MARPKIVINYPKERKTDLPTFGEFILDGLTPALANPVLPQCNVWSESGNIALHRFLHIEAISRQKEARSWDYTPNANDFNGSL